MGMCGARARTARTRMVVGSITQRRNCAGESMPAQLSKSCNTSAPASMGSLLVLVARGTSDTVASVAYTTYRMTQELLVRLVPSLPSLVAAAAAALARA